jgi:hypothetical protein
MIGWLVDNAVLFYVILGFLGVLLLVLWWQNRTRRYLIALGVVAFLAALVFLLTRFVVTDRQSLANTILRMSDDLEKHRTGDFFQNVSKSFRHEAMDVKSFRGYVQSRLNQFRVKRFHVFKLEIDKLVPKDKAKVSFRIQVEGSWEEPPPPMRCDTEFVWENERWCLLGFKLFYATLGNEFHLPTN